MNDKPSWNSTWRAWMYLLPAVVGITVFFLYPILLSFDMSLHTKYNYYKSIVYERGLDNYIFVLNDPEFWLALKNTLIYVVGVVPLSILLSLSIAMMLNSRIRFQAWFQTLYFLPLITSVVAVSLVWRWILHSEYGLLNSMLGWVGVAPIEWLTKPEWAMPSLILFSVWKGLGYNVILFLAGLQQLNPQLQLAARMDGAPKWRRFRYITLPLLAPTLGYISVVSMIHSFKAFEEVFVLFGKSPGPMSQAMTVVYYIFRKFYNESEFGIASAASYVLFLIIFVFTLIQLSIGRKKVHI
ncbi:ABC transporter permease subunit [Paenibacillus sp. LMG 31456]|uniref:ABC transporter permease subunit n=1 Tax=Paenibacillus foliorum TaxID=2654974 RepID=A0A972K3J4_9BACL|nr:sugar ABC transporter permease [Paenibacillus foliorum]NOU97030.1 ABC transporter permease subunit [Paenibacillus foliorum]